jgi:hypothetical protein
MGLNFGMTMNLFNPAGSSNTMADRDEKSEEQQQPMDIAEYVNKEGEYATNSCLESLLALSGTYTLHIRTRMK